MCSNRCFTNASAQDFVLIIIISSGALIRYTGCACEEVSSFASWVCTKFIKDLKTSSLIDARKELSKHFVWNQYLTNQISCRQPVYCVFKISPAYYPECSCQLLNNILFWNFAGLILVDLLILLIKNLLNVPLYIYLCVCTHRYIEE